MAIGKLQFRQVLTQVRRLCGQPPGRAQRRRGPVLRAHQRAHLAAAGQEGLSGSEKVTSWFGCKKGSIAGPSRPIRPAEAAGSPRVPRAGGPVPEKLIGVFGAEVPCRALSPSLSADAIAMP